MTNENPGIRLKVECETGDVNSARDWLDRVKNQILRLFEEERKAGAYGILVSDLSDGEEVVDAERTPASSATLFVDENGDAQMLVGAPNSTSREASESVPGIQVDVMRPRKGNRKIAKWVIELREALISLIQNETENLNGKAVVTFCDNPDGDEIVIAEAIGPGETSSADPEPIFIGEDAPEPDAKVQGEVTRMESLKSSNVVSYGRSEDGGLDLWATGTRPSDQTKSAGDSPFEIDPQGENPFKPKGKLLGSLRRILSYDLGRLFGGSRG